MRPNPCIDHVATPVISPVTPSVGSPGSSLSAKRMKESSGLSPVTPKRNTDTCKRTIKRPKTKLMGRFTRSMAKGNIVKPPVNDGIRVETVMIDDDEINPVLPVDDHNVGHEFISNPADDNPPAFDKDVQPIPIGDLPVKGQTVETNLPSSYQVEGVIPPMFITCLLDKIRSMEGRVTEMSSHRDVVEAENLKLKE